MKKRLVSILVCLSLCALFSVSAFAATTGTEAGYTEIWDRAGLEAMAEDPEGAYALMADIDMGDTPWRPMAFSGILEGNDHTLYNLVITEADPQQAVSVDGNHVEYDTVFAALFSRTYGATIQNLNLLNVDVRLVTDRNSFAAGLVGYAEDTTITGCSVSGRVYLEMTDRMCGVAGIMGFGYGSISACSTDMTLTLVDGNDTINCEEFMGAVLASGYADIEDCTVRLRAYTSVHGYVHNGGVVGMYYVHTDDRGHAGYVRRNMVDAEIHFFEDVGSRRAYSSPIIGEQMHWILEIADNETVNFVSDESKDYTTVLLPEACDEPAYTQTATQPGCDSFGYTTHTCGGCGYSYTDNYVSPQHQPGEWVVVREITTTEDGLRERYCTLCGELADREEMPLVPVSTCALNETELLLEPNGTARLVATVQPADATFAQTTFTSSNEAVAVVDQDGVVTAVAAGSTTILCTTAGGEVSAQCLVTVNAPAAFWPLIIAIGAVLVVLAVVLSIIAYRSNKKRR